MATSVRHNKLLIAVFLALALFAPLQVGAPNVVLAATTCPSRLPVMDSFSNMTLPPGVSEIKTALGGVKTVNQGFGKAPGGFGYTYNGVYYNPFHRGIDFDDVYQKLYSPWPAKITNYVGGGWGTGPGGPNMVIAITLSNGYTMYVLHLSDFGATGSVKAGTYIGTTGNTGFSSGPHSHIEVDGPDGSIIPPEWWACKTGAAAGSPGTTDGTAGGTTLDYTETGGTSGALPAPWVTLTGAGDMLDGAIRMTTPDFKAGVPSHADSGRVTAVLGGTDIADAGLVFRYVDPNNFFLYQCAGGHNRLYEIVGGVATELYVVEPCEAGKPLTASWTSDSVVLHDRAGGSHTIASARFAGQGTYAGVRAYRADTRITGFAYTQNADGTATQAAEAGADGPTADGNEDSGWNPMAWVWDKFKGLLVPSESDWQEIAVELDKLTDKEPIGTLKDVAMFAGSIKTAVSTPPAAGSAPSVTEATCSLTGMASMFCGATFAAVWGGGVDMSNRVADAMDQFSVAGMSGTTFVKVGMDVIAAFGVWEYLNSRTVLAA